MPERIPSFFLLLLSLVEISCIPSSPIDIGNASLPQLRDASTFSVTSSNCWSPAFIATTIDIELRRLHSSLRRTTLDLDPDILITYEHYPCAICLDCTTERSPDRAVATLTFRNGRQAHWSASQPITCAHRDCLPTILARALHEATGSLATVPGK